MAVPLDHIVRHVPSDHEGPNLTLLQAVGNLRWTDLWWSNKNILKNSGLYVVHNDRIMICQN